MMRKSKFKKNRKVKYFEKNSNFQAKFFISICAPFLRFDQVFNTTVDKNIKKTDALKIILRFLKYVPPGPI